tara:strand:- start:648 stop:935 length:288 start_codon:yes stop_codon:yes gene_type:complete
MKAYWIAIYKNSDYQVNLKDYIEKANPAIKKYNGKILVRGGKANTFEGDASPRTVVIEFSDIKDALNCYNSDEYKDAKKIAKEKFDRHVQIVEGA